MVGTPSARSYIDLWLDLLQAARPELSPGQAQLRVHAAISTIHSCLLYHSSLTPAELANELVIAASDTLGIASVAATSDG